MKLICKFSFALMLLTSTISAGGCSKENLKGNIEAISTTGSRGIYQLKLQKVLKEISGLAVTDDDRLFAHNDEKGIIYQVDTKTGNIIKQFHLGTFGITGDFEGLAIRGAKFYLTESNGTFYEFNEGSADASVEIETYKSRFSSKFEIEGLCYYPKNNSLLFASKEYPGKNYKGFKTVYAYSLDSNKIIDEPFLKIDLDKIKKKTGSKKFFPSGIAYNKLTNTIFVISSKGQMAIAEFRVDGELLNAKQLSSKYHQQPEGITFLKDGTLVISDEGAKGRATLTVYPVSFNW